MSDRSTDLWMVLLRPLQELITARKEFEEWLQVRGIPYEYRIKMGFGLLFKTDVPVRMDAIPEEIGVIPWD